MQSNAQTFQNDNAAPQNQNLQGFFADPRAYLSRDGEYLTLVLPGNMRVRKHRNWWLSVLKVPFVPKATASVQPTVEA